METEPGKGIESLLVWKKANNLALKICREIVPILPESEKFALISQLRRSVQSVAANLAEGYGRFYYQEGVHFSYIARGSLEETYNHLTFARGMNYLSEESYLTLLQEIEELRRMINGYVTYLKKSKRGITEPGAPHGLNSEVSMIEEKDELQ